VVDRRAEAAAVNAMASGSQHGTIMAISHWIARSLSAAAPGPSMKMTFQTVVEL
jgi:hypothetical protein